MDSLKGLAAMKSLAASKDDTPEGEEERDKVGICGAVLCLPFAIAMVIVGSQYWPGPCYGQEIFLIKPKKYSTGSHLKNYWLCFWDYKSS